MSNRKRLLLVPALLLLGAAFVYAIVPDQPFMEKARANLQGAKAELQSAEHNKGGHRAKALEYVNAAISEVNQGIRFAREHNHATAPANIFTEAAGPDQPHMQAALTNLETAKTNLQQATADKGGHRAKAIDLVNQAIDEVKKGIAAGQ